MSKRKPSTITPTLHQSDIKLKQIIPISGHVKIRHTNGYNLQELWGYGIGLEQDTMFNQDPYDGYQSLSRKDVNDFRNIIIKHLSLTTISTTNR